MSNAQLVEQSLPRRAVVFSGSIAGDEPHTDLISFITQFQDLNAHNDRTLMLRIHSSGGYPEQINTVRGLLRAVRREGHKVIVHVLGQLCNFTIRIALAADEIWMEPTASFSFEQMDLTITGTSRHIKNYFAFQNGLFDDLIAEMVERSARFSPDNKLDDSVLRNWKAHLITAQEAKDWGLCDQVLPWPAPVTKTRKEPKNLTFNGKFDDDKMNRGHLIWLHLWLEDNANDGVPLRVYFTSIGGTVAQALALFGLLLQAQREGHHVTIHVLGEVYSCALWFLTLALKSGIVVIDSAAKLMYHAPNTTVSGRADHISERLAVQDKILDGTRQLLIAHTALTSEVLDTWEVQPDRYMSAKEAESFGLGTVV